MHEVLLGAAQDERLALGLGRGHLDDDARLLHDLHQAVTLLSDDVLVLRLLDQGRQLAARAFLQSVVVEKINGGKNSHTKTNKKCKFGSNDNNIQTARD